MSPVIDVRNLNFSYQGDRHVVLNNLCFQLEQGSRCLLLGANGAGKTTLLRVLAGRHMIPEQSVHVLGRLAFHDTSLARDVAFLGGSFPLNVDICVTEILARQQNVDAHRQRGLLEILGIDLAWRMHRVSDGQRRRVQLLLALLSPRRLLLLDEATRDLDLVARADLLTFLKDESESLGVTIVYATHIMDCLERWATHLAWIEKGNIERFSRLGDFPELVTAQNQIPISPLFALAEGWLRK